MPKVGRNEPCPCGSGKKYKKCCMEKDEQQERETRARIEEAIESVLGPRSAEPRSDVSPLYVGDLFEDEDEEYETEEESELWHRFGEADYEGKIGIFLEALEAEQLDDVDAFDMLSDIWVEAKDRGQQGRFDELVDRLRQKLPEAYEEDWPYYNDWLLESALARGDTAIIPKLLEPFAREPDRDIDQFLWVADLLMYHDQPRPLREAMLKAWPAVGSSANLGPDVKNHFGSIAIQLTLLDQLERGGAPEITDPELQKALSPFSMVNAERLPDSLAALSGQRVRPWTVADFEYRGGQDRDAVERAAFIFGQQWLGDLHWRQGIPFSRGDLARVALAFYQSQQIAEGRLGQALLVPRSTTLSDLIDSLFGVEETQSYKVASLMELLPLYLRFLVKLGLLGEAEGQRVLKSLRRAATRTSTLLREEHDRDVAEAVERAWQ